MYTNFIAINKTSQALYFYRMKLLDEQQQKKKIKKIKKKKEAFFSLFLKSRSESIKQIVKVNSL